MSLINVNNVHLINVNDVAKLSLNLVRQSQPRSLAPGNRLWLCRGVPRSINLVAILDFYGFFLIAVREQGVLQRAIKTGSVTVFRG